MKITIRIHCSANLPVDGEGLRPDLLAGETAAQVARRTIRAGRDLAAIGDLFRVAEEPGGEGLVLAGDLRSVRGLGAGMASGCLTIRGDAGDDLGRGMSGGAIVVEGSAGDRVGAEMRGGAIAVGGPAGDDLGAALPGGRIGMRGGSILVRGAIGHGAGRGMRRGLIAAESAGDDLGRGMIAGTIVVRSGVGRRPGSGMKRGTLLLLGDEPPILPPGFRAAGWQEAPFAAIYLQWLRARGFPAPAGRGPARFFRYNGDAIEGGRGEVLVGTPGVS